MLTQPQTHRTYAIRTLIVNGSRCPTRAASLSVHFDPWQPARWDLQFTAEHERLDLRHYAHCEVQADIGGCTLTGVAMVVRDTNLNYNLNGWSDLEGLEHLE